MSQEIDLVVKICGSKFLHSTIVSKEQLSRLNIDAKEQKIQEKDFLSLQTDCNGCQQHLTLNVFWYDDEHLVKREPRVVIEPLINIKEEIKQSDDDDSMDFDDHEDTKSSEEKPFVYDKSGVTKYISYPGLTYLLPPGLQLPSFDNVEVPYFAKIKQKDGSVVYAEKKRKKKCPVRITNYDPRVVNCDICGYKVPSADRLTAHRKGHMFFRFADEICRGCGKNCGDSHAEKLNHSFFCVGKDKINGLACPECLRYVASDYKKLRNHMKKKHKGYNPVPEPNRENEVTCELCGTKALDDYALHLHQKFKCPMNEEYLAQTKAFTEGYLKDLDLPATVVLPDIYKIKGKQSQMIPQADGTQIYFSKGTNYLEIMNFDPRREKCELCGKSHMLKKSEIVEHRLKRHFFPNENDTECPGCGKHCHTLAQKTTHSHFCPLKHSIRVNYCEKCATPYPNYSKYAKHLLRRHDGEGLDKKFMCHFCSATYDTNRELLQHVIRHDDPRPFKCHHCSEDFKGKTGVEGHLIRTHFPHESKFSCQTCETPQLFGTLKSYKAHMNAVHFKTKEREPCRYCGIMIRKAGMETHVRRQHTEHDLKEKFACQTCGKLFVSANNLKVHERVHLPEHQRAHKCRFCERRFNSNRVCIEHERYHTGDKPYKCDICGKAYARSQTLKDHQREHTGEGFRCTVCSKMLTDRGNFRHHMKQHESQLGVKLTLNHEDRRLIKLKVITEEQAFRGDGPGK